MSFVLFYQQSGCLPDYTAVYRGYDLVSFVREELSFFSNNFDLDYTSDRVDQLVSDLIRDGFLQSPIHSLHYFSLVQMDEEEIQDLLWE
jgi:hypothetical protein